MNETLEAVPDRLMVGEWQFSVRAHEIVRDGKTVRLEPRVAKLLLYLATHAGEAVTRAALLEALWPGMIVTDEALTNAVNKLRRAFGDDRARPQVVETIPKAGYRLIAAVQRITHEPVHMAPESRHEAASAHAKPVWLFPAAGLALILAATLVVWLVMTMPASEPEPAHGRPEVPQDTSVGVHRPALAVLRFDNLSEDQTQEYFADGIADDVTTHLAKNHGLMVIARDSSFFYKGKSMDPRVIAENLNVDYILRGSLRRDGDVLKINAWLVDAENGDHVWAEHYEQKAGQVLQIQNDIARNVTTALIATDTVYPETTKTTDNPQAYDNLLLGRHHFYRFESPAENLKARSYFEEAVRLDPGFAVAHAMLAWTYAFEAMNGWADDRLAALQQAERIATLAIEIQPILPLAHFVRGLSYREQHEYVKALVEAQNAIEYDPNDANGRVLLATLLYYAGRPEEGLANILKAMEINPHHPYNYHFHLGQAYFVLHRYREAIDALNDGLSSNPASERMRVWLAAALAHSGDIEAAEWEAEQIMAANPDFSLQRMAEAFPFNDPADMEHFLAGLRLAGLQ